MIKINPVLIELYGVEIRWYSVIMLFAILICLLLVIKETRRFNIPKDFTFNLAFWVIIMGIVGARLYYCAFNFNLYKDNLIDILKIWEGGLAIHGALLGGFITLAFYSKRYNIRIIKMTDIVVVPLLLAQAIGRWGNFFNSEAHGSATTYRFLKSLFIPDKIIEGMKIGNIYYHPTFLYESVYCLVGFIFLLILRRYKYLKKGQLTSIYLMYYSVGRFFIERLRTDSLMLGGFRVAQIVSVVLFLIGLGMFMIIGRKTKFEDLYSEEQRGSINY